MNRRLKQIFYGGIYLGLLLLIIIPFYNTFLKPAPSCKDGVQNQNEEGIDCGGVCATICLPADLQPITLAERPRIFLPLPERLSVLIRFKNPNPEYGATFQYQLTISDEANQPLGSLSREEFLFPGQIKYVLVPNFSLKGVERVTQADVQIGTTNWVPQAYVAQPQVALRNESTAEEEGVLRVRGTVVNEDIRPAKKVVITALFANQWGGTLGVSATTLEQVLAGETRDFSISHPPMINVNLEETKVFVSAE